MDPEGIMLSKISHTRKDKYCMTYFIYTSNVKNKQTKNHSYRGEKKWLPKEEGLRSGPNG